MVSILDVSVVSMLKVRSAINFDKDGNIPRQSPTSRVFIVYKDSYSKMLEELAKEMDIWISGSESGKRSEDLLFKKVEKRKSKK